MKTEAAVIDGVFVVTCEYEGLSAQLDVSTGEVLDIVYAEVNIVKLNQFIAKVKSRYSTFAATQLASDFMK